MADARAGSTRGRRLRGRPLLVLVVTTVIPLLTLACLAHGFLDPAAPGGAGAGVIVLVVVAALGIAGGGWLIAGARPAGPETDAGAAMATLPMTVARQAEEIARQQARLQEVLEELDATKARLRETSFKDELTGLYNRRFFVVRLEEEISRHRRFKHPVAVVLFDLDGFKEINDEQGHLIGDETLRDIGQILMKYSRGINVVARYGGDEFAVLLVETSKAGASLYAERIRQILATHPHAHGRCVTASFGVASLPEDDAATSEELVRLADETLYVAKRGGKNQVAETRPADARGA